MKVEVIEMRRQGKKIEVTPESRVSGRLTTYLRAAAQFSQSAPAGVRAAFAMVHVVLAALIAAGTPEQSAQLEDIRTELAASAHGRGGK